MSGVEEHWSFAAADAALENLLGRRGVGQSLSTVQAEDEETWGEIREADCEVYRIEPDGSLEATREP